MRRPERRSHEPAQADRQGADCPGVVTQAAPVAAGQEAPDALACRPRASCSDVRPGAEAPYLLCGVPVLCLHLGTLLLLSLQDSAGVSLDHNKAVLHHADRYIHHLLRAAEAQSVLHLYRGAFPPELGRLRSRRRRNGGAGEGAAGLFSRKARQGAAHSPDPRLLRPDERNSLRRL